MKIIIVYAKIWIVLEFAQIAAELLIILYVFLQQLVYDTIFIHKICTSGKGFKVSSVCGTGT
jgi:hypothetical protein